MGRQARDNRIVALGRMFVAGVILAVAGLAPAQPATPSAPAPTWRAGATLAAPGASGKPGTLAFEAKSNEREYAVQNTNMTLSLKLLRLSGERELPLHAAEIDAQKNVFGGTMGSLKFQAVDDKNAIVEFQTEPKIQGLAFAELRSNATETSATVEQKMGVRVIDSRQAVHLMFEGAPRAFRESVPNGYRVVVPIEGGQKVTLKLNISEFTEPLAKSTPAPAPTEAPTATEAAPAAATPASTTEAAAAAAQTMTPTVEPTPANATPSPAPATPTIGNNILSTPVPVDPAVAPGARRAPPAAP